ncbi:MAG: RNA polymerase sigma factor [Mangrovibacterium sp.]
MEEKKYVDEQVLIQKLVSGDEMAFELLFYRYRGKVADFIRRSVPPQVDVEETALEVFLRVWLSRERIDSQRSFAPYLFRIARNLVIDLLRRNVEHTIYLQNESFSADFCSNEAELNIEERELQSWLESVMNKLPEQRKKIFMMSRFQGLTYPEIAKNLNISENTVDTQIRRSLDYFRNELKRIKILLLFF